MIIPYQVYLEAVLRNGSNTRRFSRTNERWYNPWGWSINDGRWFFKFSTIYYNMYYIVYIFIKMLLFMILLDIYLYFLILMLCFI